MEFLFLILGILLGSIITYFINISKSSYGFIDVDHKTNMCNVHVTSDELADRKNKKVIFKINHDANISREEQIL